MPSHSPLSSQDLSNTLWAFATLRHYPGAELLDGCARQAALSKACFKPQEVANLLWSFATLGHDPGEGLLVAMALQMVAQMQHFRPQVRACPLHPVAQWRCICGRPAGSQGFVENGAGTADPALSESSSPPREPCCFGSVPGGAILGRA